MMILLIVITLAAIAIAVWAITTRNQSSSSPTEQTSTEVVSTPEPLTDTIALPQFAWLNLKADVAEQSLTFDNPTQNFAAFRVSIVLDGETLWESEALRPGDTSAYVVLSRPLPKGEYQASLVYTCFTNDDAQSPLNGANSPILLKVK